VTNLHYQTLLDISGYLTGFMSYPFYRPLANTPLPALPTDSRKHYVDFLYSDGDNPRVIFDELTLKGNDRYASPQRGKIPMGWTLPPTIPDYAAPIVSQIYAAATPNDEFLAGPSGYGFAFPSVFPQRPILANRTEQAMARMGLSDVLVLDTDGNTGFTNSVLDPLTSPSNVRGVFYSTFNGHNQPKPGSILWSSNKPVLPTVTVHRSSANQDIVTSTARMLNAGSTDATSGAGYTIVYVEFWSVSMSDVAQIVSRLEPNVRVVRPDVLEALAEANIRH